MSATSKGITSTQKVSADELVAQWLALHEEYTALRAKANAATGAAETAFANLNTVGQTLLQIAEVQAEVYSVNGTGVLLQRGHYPRAITLKKLS